MNLTDTVLSVLQESGCFAIPLSLLISIVVAAAGIVPSVFVTGANVLFFGPVNGFFISWFGEIAGAAVSFHLYKSGFKKRFENIKENQVGKPPLRTARSPFGAALGYPLPDLSHSGQDHIGIERVAAWQHTREAERWAVGLVILRCAATITAK